MGIVKRKIIGVAIMLIGSIMVIDGMQTEHVSGEPSKGFIQIGLMILAAGLSYLAGQMLQKKSDSPIKSDKPTTLSSRGSFVPWFVGIRRVGPVFCWAGRRATTTESSAGSGGKGGGGSEEGAEVIIYKERGWHVLGIGPVYALHRIFKNGKVIFQGPITATSHPSGSEVDLGKQGKFKIYWGEQDQPINTDLGKANRVGISSRWPFICYITWGKKRLGTAPIWPELQYELERRPSNTLLTDSDGFYDGILTLSGNQRTIIDHNANSDQDVGYLEFDKDKTKKFHAGAQVKIAGNGLPNADYIVLRSEIKLTLIGFGFAFSFITTTRVFFVGGTAGANSSGTAEIYDSDGTEGANVAHVLAEMLFADYPKGLGIDPEHMVEKWDMDSLETLGTEAETEGWRASILATEGEVAESLLGATLQDHGVLLPIDTDSGSLLFNPVRAFAGTPPNMVDALYAGKLPEIEVIHGEQPVDNLIFSFADRENKFSDMTIAVGDDAQATFMRHTRPRKVPMVSTVHFPTAALLSELRAPEELAHSAEFRIEAAREARDLIPGDVITADGIDEAMRVTSVTIDVLSEVVKVSVFPDFYGDKSAFETNPGGLIPDPIAVEVDPLFIWFELPEQILGVFPAVQTIVMPRVREHNEIVVSSMWTSLDDITYSLAINQNAYVAGGTLDADFVASDPTFLTQGPIYTEEGPDNADILQDLSGDLTNWGLGKQLCVIMSTAGIEICFLQKATIVSGTQRRLDGLSRARYDTRKVTHPAGAFVLIFDLTNLTRLQSPILQPATDLYLKSQPGTDSDQVLLSSVGYFLSELAGKGQVPIKPSIPYVTAPYVQSPSFKTGNNITISWGVSSGSVGTGAGFQGAGSPVATPAIPGTVQIELLTTGDVLKDTIGLDATTVDFEITNAALVAAFTSEPSAFKVRVTHVANGQSSTVSDTLTITRV